MKAVIFSLTFLTLFSCVTPKDLLKRVNDSADVIIDNQNLIKHDLTEDEFAKIDGLVADTKEKAEDIKKASTLQSKKNRERDKNKIIKMFIFVVPISFFFALAMVFLKQFELAMYGGIVTLSSMAFIALYDKLMIFAYIVAGIFVIKVILSAIMEHRNKKAFSELVETGEHFKKLMPEAVRKKIKDQGSEAFRIQSISTTKKVREYKNHNKNKQLKKFKK